MRGDLQWEFKSDSILGFRFGIELSLSVLTAIFPRDPGLAGFIEAKDDRSGGDNWSYKSCKAAVKSSPPTNQHPTFYRPDALPVAQPTASEHKGRIWHWTIFEISPWRPVKQKAVSGSVTQWGCVCEPCRRAAARTLTESDASSLAPTWTCVECQWRGTSRTLLLSANRPRSVCFGRLLLLLLLLLFLYYTKTAAQKYTYTVNT